MGPGRGSALVLGLVGVALLVVGMSLARTNLRAALRHVSPPPTAAPAGELVVS